MPDATILIGDVRERLAELPDGSVQACITSPPYWGLRDYGHDGQIGLEPTPDAYVAEMVAVFREVRRVLADDGTCWVNLGDSYASQGRAHGGREDNQLGVGAKTLHAAGSGDQAARIAPDGLKPKDLVGIPWRVAFALQADGWWLRQDIIWAKPNPMPESVTDRCTKAHEYLFLLTKSARYYYDANPLRTPHEQKYAQRRLTKTGNPDGLERTWQGQPEFFSEEPQTFGHPLGANKRSVWSIHTQPFPGAHFAVMPEALVEPCVLAGSRPAGKRCDCDEVVATPLGSGTVEDPTPQTGRAGMNRPRRDNEGTAPITRRQQRWDAETIKVSPHRADMERATGSAFAHYIRTDSSGARPVPPALRGEWLRDGWLTEAPDCDHPVMPADTILDPFTGSGTVGVVALKHGRHFVGTELNPEYAALAEARIRDDGPLFNEVRSA